MHDGWIVPRSNDNNKLRSRNRKLLPIKRVIKYNTSLENVLEPTKGRSFRLNNITDYVTAAAVQMKIIEG